MTDPAIDLADLDPTRKPFHKVAELERYGFGCPRVVYAAIAAGEIPVVRVGRRQLVPTAWIRRVMQLDAPEPNGNGTKKEEP